MSFSVDWFSSNIPLWESIFSTVKKDTWKCLEIGSFQGRSAIWVLDNVKNLDTITCVDTWEGPPEHPDEIKKDLFEIFSKNVAPYGDKVIVKSGKSRDVLRTLEKGYDFIYIDGSHEKDDVLTDAVLAFDLLNDNGVIVFDDYQHNQPVNDVQRGVQAFMSCYHEHFRLLHIGYQLVIIKK